MGWFLRKKEKFDSESLNLEFIKFQKSFMEFFTHLFQALWLADWSWKFTLFISVVYKKLKRNSFEFATAVCGHFELQKNPPSPKIVFFQLFVISSNFPQQIFDILLQETKTALQRINTYTRSSITWSNHLLVPETGWTWDTLVSQIAVPSGISVGRWTFIQD